MEAEKKEDKKKLFISYSHQDDIIAFGVARFLINQGYDVWIDNDKLKAGQEWAKEVNEAINKSSFIFIRLLRYNE